MPIDTSIYNNIQQPDPNKSLATISSIIGLKQQQQALQTGQYLQNTAQAESQQAQQKNMELTRVGNLVKNAYSSGAYKDADGNFDNTKFANDVAQVAPTYGQMIANEATARAGEIYTNQQTLTNLKTSQREQIGNTLAALAANPNITHSDVIDAIEAMRDQYKGVPGMSRMLTSFGMSIPVNATSGQLQQSLRTVGMSLNAPATAQTNPQVSTIQAPGGLQPIQTNPQAPGGIKPIGQPFQQGVAPGTTNAAGQFVTGGPQTGIAPVQGNANPTSVQVEAQRGIAQGVVGRVQQAMAASNNTQQAQDALGRAQAILEKPDALTTGGSFETARQIKNFLSSAGIDTQGADDANSLVKNLARYEAARATAAGLGGTDAARELAHNGSPNTAVDNKALLGIIKQSLATEKAMAAYSSKQTGVTDPNKMAEIENRFRNIPNLIEGYEYGMSRTPQEADQFLKEHGLTKADMAKTRAAIRQFESQ